MGSFGNSCGAAQAPNLTGFEWLMHGFGFRDSQYPDGITGVRQIHSGIVATAAEVRNGFVREADALVTDEHGVTVGIRTADCVPVLIADPVTRSVAAIHAGWRGSAKNIAANAVSELVTRYGARAEDLHAAIGPAIGGCCYEVGPEVARRFGAWIPEYGRAESPVKIDLGRVNRMQLEAAGVRDVWNSGECTNCNPERYFSFRREREKAGRMTAFIGRRS